MTQHGACLGLGLAALGTQDEEVFEEIKNVLYTDSAVAGEAAGIALGLVSVGSASEKAAELLTYAHDTQHEKVQVMLLLFYISAAVYSDRRQGRTCISHLEGIQEHVYVHL